MAGERCGIVTRMPSSPGGFEMPLWRAVAVFRVASLAYVCLVALREADRYAHPSPAPAWSC